MSKEFNTPDTNHTVMSERRVAVVGGGITGLALAHYLDGYDVEYTLFESDERPGGVMQSREVDGKVVDLGPQRTRLSPMVENLVGDVGLESSVSTASDDLPLHIYHDGELRLAPTSLKDGLRTNLLSWRTKIRMTVEPWKSLTGEEPETAEEFIRHRFGDEAYQRFLGPLYGGIYASDPGDMSYEHSVKQMVETRGIDGSVLTWAAKKSITRKLHSHETPPPCSFDGGMGALPEAVAEEHGENVYLGESVENLTGDGRGFTVETQERSEEFDFVVLSTPADAAGRLLEEIDEKTANALDNLRYNDLVSVHLNCSEVPESLGFQTSFDEELDTLGATFVGSMFDRGGQVTSYLGGGRNPDAVLRDDEELMATGESDIEEVVGGSAEAFHVNRVRMPSYDGSWTDLSKVDPPEGIYLTGNYLSRAGVPGRLREASSTAEALAEAVSAEE